MKKLLILSLAALMVIAFTLPASALENVFGGYWRTRAFSQQNFSGDESLGRDTKAAVRALGVNLPGDLSRVDTRTRLYYTAILNDNLKFVNKFEMDATWGSPGYGDIGTDGLSFEVKHTFADVTMGALRATIGAQGHVIARGFIFDDDYAGITASYKMGDHLIPFTWARLNEGGTDLNASDADMFALWPVFQLGESWSLNPFAVWVYSDDTDPANVDNAIAGPGFISSLGLDLNDVADDGVSIYWLGLSVDGNIGGFSLWGTGIYQGGTADDTVLDDWDIKAYMFALGASVPLGPASVHSQFFYASGDDDLGDSDIEEFFGTNGQSYYWSEIMGYGTFDNVVSVGSPGNKIGNIMAFNIGATIKPMEKLSLTGDIWYAAKVEDDILSDEKDLGIEVDLKASYQLVEGMNLDVIGAYLFADDATSILGENEDDPWEVGTQLSLSF
jgi:hypothetical protein